MVDGLKSSGGENGNIDITNQPLLRAFRATVAYDGSGFSGSQLQKNDRTVLSEINRALSKVLAHPVRATMASRTDAGVHATGQVIGFRTSSPRTSGELLRALNSLLPGDVRVTECREAGLDFHPRYSALGKVYLYRILRADVLPPMSRNSVFLIEEHKPFDFDLLSSMAGRLEGERDFRSFSPRLEEGEKAVKTIWKVTVREDRPLLETRIIGSGFLYQMVRRMMGLLIAVAGGRENEEALADALDNPEKGKVTYNASPSGLFLEKVLYSDEEIREAIESAGS